MRSTPAPMHSSRRRATLAVALLLAGCAPRVGAPEAPGPIPDIRSIPKVDVHAHYRTNQPELIEAMRAWNMRAVLVNVASDTAQIDDKWRDMRALHAAHPDRFALVATFDPFRFNEPDFVPRVVAELRDAIAAGARGVKVWKNIGMEVRDPEGRYVQIDHPRFQPIWDFLVERNIPVIAHIAEPQAAWLPLDRDDPHFWYYGNNPQYHAYQHPEMPRWETIIAARDRWLARNPRLVVIGAHMASLERDVGEVAKRLDAYPNLYVETAARVNDLAMQPSERVRDFMIRYQDRVLWGTDLGESSVSGPRLDAAFAQHWSYLAGADTVMMGSATGWNRRVPGLALPRPVLEKIGHRNAERVLKLPPAGR